MARRILAAIGVVWTLAGVAAIVLGLGFAESLVPMLPPLAIDAPALGGAITAFGIALALAGLAHLALWRALRGGARWARSGAVLLAAVGCAAMLSLTAASLTSAAREAALAAPLLVGSAAAAVGTALYALLTARLTRELRSESAS